jgi:DMSO/TMAO reductase YedYZ molybdopterin-dependent catalytic subunit
LVSRLDYGEFEPTRRKAGNRFDFTLTSMTMIEPAHRGLARREFVKQVALGALPAAAALAAGRARSQDKNAPPRDPQAVPSDVIVRQNEPDNLEYPFANLTDFHTPNDRFYVRNHFAVPEIDFKDWRLRIEGAVERPIELGIDELRKMPARKVTALLECSGNGRIRLKPPQLGIRWDKGAVGNAEWTGVPLSEVLKRAGVRSDAVEVILEGADRGQLDAPLTKSPGEISFARSLPMSKAKQPEVLLAYQMNGQDLPVAHGRPVRVVVPGWYGMASVKWLTRIVVSQQPFRGYFQALSYTVWKRRAGIAEIAPVEDIQVKTQIARPTRDEVVATNSRYRIFGAAWTGEGHIAKVEVSTDGGKGWSPARLLGERVRYAWRLWEHPWATPTKAGRHILMSRATDDRGNVQPMERDPDRRDAIITHVEPVPIEVR